jgi:cell division septal protein FtsQ
MLKKRTKKVKERIKTKKKPIHGKRRNSLLKLRILKNFKFFSEKFIHLLYFALFGFLLFLISFNSEIGENLKGKMLTYYYKYSYDRFCYNINIEGTINTSNEYILSIINKYCDDRIKDEINYKNYKKYIFPLIKIKEEIATIPWIKEVEIQRKLPYTVNVKVQEYIPFALWKEKNGNKLKLIDETGFTIPVAPTNISEFYDLIVISGKNARGNLPSLFNLLSINSDLSLRIDFANWVGNRRWNVIFENGTVVKLPETNLIESWVKLIELYRINGLFLDLKVLDLRVEGKVYLEYKDKVSREIRTLK